MAETRVKHIEYIQIANLKQDPSLETAVGEAISQLESQGRMIMNTSISSIILRDDPIWIRFDILITHK